VEQNGQAESLSDPKESCDLPDSLAIFNSPQARLFSLYRRTLFASPLAFLQMSLPTSVSLDAPRRVVDVDVLLVLYQDIADTKVSGHR
jgi:hypothetical protein